MVKSAFSPSVRTGVVICIQNRCQDLVSDRDKETQSKVISQTSDARGFWVQLRGPVSVHKIKNN